MKNLLANQLYAALYEILKDKDLYYYTTIGSEYCKFTDLGEKEVLKFLNIVAPKIIEEEKDKLVAYARDYVVQELKK